MMGPRIDRFQRLPPCCALGAIPACWALAALAVAGAIGCSSEGDPHGPCSAAGGPSTERATFGGIDYAVVGGLTGHGDGTTLHVAPDGSFSRNTPERGGEQGALGQAALADLIARARGAQFPTLCMMYAAPSAADDLVYQVSVQFDGREITSQVSQDGDPPDRLQLVVDALQQIVDLPVH